MRPDMNKALCGFDVLHLGGDSEGSAPPQRRQAFRHVVPVEGMAERHGRIFLAQRRAASRTQAALELPSGERIPEICDERETACGIAPAFRNIQRPSGEYRRRAVRVDMTKTCAAVLLGLLIA